MIEVFQAIFSGLSSGAMYALMAVGISLIYSSTRIINFAQGEFVMLGGMIMASLYGDMKLPFLPAFALTIAIVTLVGVALKWIVYRQNKRTPLVTILIITIGVSTAISGLSMHVWDKNFHRYPGFTGQDPIIIGGASILPQSLWVIGTTILLLVILAVFLGRSVEGKAIRACAIDPLAATIMGIKVNRMVLLSFIFSAALGAVAGILVTPITMMEYSGGMLMALKGFSAAIFGGMGSVAGVVLGGFIIGLLESFSAMFLSSGYKDLITFLVIINILLFRPNGLMGRKTSGALREEDDAG
jgi:branched-chain amino acid transport system permease protein